MVLGVDDKRKARDHSDQKKPRAPNRKVILLYQFSFFPDSIPEELKLGSGWVCCDNEKVPMVPLMRGTRQASSTNSDTWRTYETAVAALERFPSRYAGIGRVIEQGSGYVGVDIDGCRDSVTGRIDERGLGIL